MMSDMFGIIQKYATPLESSRISHTEVPTPDGNKFTMQRTDAVSERIVEVKQAVSFFDDAYAPDMYTELFDKLKIPAGIPMLIERIERKLIKNVDIWVAVVLFNMGDIHEHCEQMPTRFRMSLSERFMRRFLPFTNINMMKNVVLVRVRLEKEQEFKDQPYATLEAESLIRLIKQEKELHDKQTNFINGDGIVNAKDSVIKRIAKRWANTKSEEMSLNSKLLSRWSVNKFEEFLASSSNKDKLPAIGTSTGARIARPMISDNVNNDNEE